MQLEMEYDIEDDEDDDDDDEDDEEEEEELPPQTSAVVRVSRNSAGPALSIPPRQVSSQQTSAATQPRKGSPQMVTIRRVMEHSSAEPTVTITLKGDTPEKDTVLFTLVNGQGKPISIPGYWGIQGRCNDFFTFLNTWEVLAPLM